MSLLTGTCPNCNLYLPTTYLHGSRCMRVHINPDDGIRCMGSLTPSVEFDQTINVEIRGMGRCKTIKEAQEIEDRRVKG